MVSKVNYKCVKKQLEKKTLQYVKMKCKKYHKLVAYKYKCVYYVYNTK